MISLWELLGKIRDGSGTEQEMARLAIKGLVRRPEGFDLAVDFDGTLCRNMYPDIGMPIGETIRQVKLAKDYGVRVALWTCRQSAYLDKAIAWCAAQGIELDAVNDNTEERKAFYGNNPRKIGYHELWDDRAVRMG